jgi:tetratricopeptide (TPR) repeat protein
MNKDNLLNFFIRFPLYALAFLMPLFFLTGTFEWFEINKFYLLFFCTSISGLAFLFKKIVKEKEINFKLSLDDIFILIFLAVACVSVFFSVDKNASFIGAYQRQGNGFLALICMIVVYFLLKNRKDFDLNKKTIINIFLVSGLILNIIFLLSIIGVWGKLTFLPQNVSRMISGIGSDSIILVAGYFGLLLTVLVSQILKNGKFKIKGIIFLIALISALFLLNQTLVWAILFIVFAVFAIFGLKNKAFSDHINYLLLPIILGLFCLLMAIPSGNSMMMKLKFPNVLVATPEQNIGILETYKIALKGGTETLTSVLFGSGIGTYPYDYLKNKNDSINRDPYRTGAYLGEILATMGFLALITYIEIFLLAFLIFKNKSQNSSEGRNIFTNFIPILFLFLMQFFCYTNIVLLFYFWMFLGLLNPDEKNVFHKSIKLENPERNLLANTFLIICFITVVCFWYMGARFWMADNNFAKAQISNDINQKIKLTEKAITLNNNVYQYYIALADDYWQAFAIDLSGQKVNDKSEIILRLNKILEASQRAIKIASNRSIVWQSAGNLYKQISITLNSLGAGKEIYQKTLDALKEAKELDPKNSYIYLIESQVYAGMKDYDKALESVNQGLEQMKDIVLVLQKINILDLSGKSKEAFAYASQSQPQYKGNLDLIFQTARLAYKTGNKVLAKQIFSSIVSAIPNESNSLYFLAVIYEEENNISTAVKLYQKVLDLNPDNSQLKQKINSLESGQIQAKEK